MYLPTSVFYFRVALAVLYAIWLVVIKPMSKRWQVAMQSLIAIFVGVTALMVVFLRLMMFRKGKLLIDSL